MTGRGSSFDAEDDVETIAGRVSAINADCRSDSSFRFASCFRISANTPSSLSRSPSF